MTRPQTSKVQARLAPSADRRDMIPYPGGHIWRVNRAHVDHVLAVKATAGVSGRVG